MNSIVNALNSFECSRRRIYGSPFYALQYFLPLLRTCMQYFCVLRLLLRHQIIKNVIGARKTIQIVTVGLWYRIGCVRCTCGCIFLNYRMWLKRLYMFASTYWTFLYGMSVLVHNSSGSIHHVYALNYGNAHFLLFSGNYAMPKKLVPET